MLTLQSPIPEQGLVGDLGWVDVTALVILLLFFVLGMFRGALWQVSRIVTLLAAYWLSVRFGPDISPTLEGWFSADTDPRIPLFLSYLLVFIAVLIVVSIVTVFLEKLVRSAGLTFYNRLGGGVLGLATGGLAVVALMTGFLMFLGSRDVAKAAWASHTIDFSRQALGFFGESVPEQVRELYGLEESPDRPDPDAPSDEPPGK